MSSEGSFPHTPPEPDPDPSLPHEEERAPVARVLDFPTDEVSSPGVPAGTWADEDAEAAAHAEQLLRPAGGGQVVEFPRPGTHKRRRPARESETRVRDASGAQRTQEPVPPEPERDGPAPRPEYLASELLKHDWWPAAPLARTLRASAIAIGLVGAVTVLALGGIDAQSLGLAGLLGLCALGGVLPLTATQRALAVAGTGAVGTVWVSWVSAVESNALSTPLLSACIALASSALFFRAAHKLSKLARALVGVGLASTVGWLVLSGGLDALIVEQMSWQAWLGPCSRATLGLIVLAGVLSFLDPTGHGGAWASAVALLSWLAVDTGIAVAVALLPAQGATATLTAPLMAAAALPFFVALASVGLCQGWVMLQLRLRNR